MVLMKANEPVVGAFVRLIPLFLIGGRPQLVGGPGQDGRSRDVSPCSLVPGKYLVVVPSVQWAVPASTSLFTLSGTTPEAVAAAEAAGRDTRVTRNPLVPLTETYALMLGAYPTPPPAPSAGGRAQAYPITFYPQAHVLSEASAVELSYGEERSAVDIRLRPVPTVRVTGRVEGPEDALQNLTLRLIPSGMEGLGQGNEAATSLVEPDGSFTFLNVPSGSYSIVARRAIAEYRYNPPGASVSSNPLPSHPATFGYGESASAVYAAPTGTMFWNHTAAGNQLYAGRTTVDVGASDVHSVAVSLRRGVTISGRVVEEITRPQSKGLPFMDMQAEPADGDPMLGRSHGRGEKAESGSTFTLQGLQSGEYLLRSIGGGMIKSIQWQDKNYTYTPFDTSSGQDITGRRRHDDGCRGAGQRIGS